MKKIVATVLGLGIALTGFPNTSALADSNAFDPLTMQVLPGNIVEYVVEPGVAEKVSYLAIMPGAVTDPNAKRVWQWCTGLDDPICDPKKAPAGLKADSFLPPCETAAQENCIDSIEIGTDGTLVKGNLIRVTAGLTFPANPEYNYIGSSNISLWNAPGVKSASGDTTYAVMARAQSYFSNGKFYIGDFYADVVPYHDIKDSKYRQVRINNAAGATAEYRYTYSPDQQICAYEEDNVCGLPQDFLANTRIRLKLRLSKEVGGWFQGRLKDPSLSVESFSPTTSIVSVEASPVTVPRLATVVPLSNLSDYEKVMHTNMGQWPTADNGIGSGPQAGIPETAFPFIDFYRSRVKDTAAGVTSYWNFSTTAWGNGSSCLRDKSKLLGIVTTNSMAYDGNAPSFSDGSLNYRVSGLHFMPDGITPVLGTYNLVMRSDVARCLYGLSPAPIKASISIVGGSDSVVATTTQGESNGWLSLAASGFTYSEKQIQVKLTQDLSVASTNSATKIPSVQDSKTKATSKPITIMCTKSKLTKRVTALKPVCPKGYVKK